MVGRAPVQCAGARVGRVLILHVAHVCVIQVMIMIICIHKKDTLQITVTNKQSPNL